MAWKNIESDWNTFADHIERLASKYNSDQREQFIRDFALVFAGLRYDIPWTEAMREVKNGPTLRFLQESNQGLSEAYQDSLLPIANQSHHYAGIFFLAAYVPAPIAGGINYARDPDNPGDIALGNAAVAHAQRFISAYNWQSAIVDIADLVSGLSQ